MSSTFPPLDLPEGNAAQSKPAEKRRQHLRVSVFPEEKELIEANAKRAGVSVARYLRDVGQGYGRRWKPRG